MLGAKVKTDMNLSSSITYEPTSSAVKWIQPPPRPPPPDAPPISDCTQIPIMVARLSLTSLDTVAPPTRPNFTAHEAFTFLQNCNGFKQMKQIHSKIIRTHLSNDQLLVAKMIRLCSSYGKLNYATVLFEHVEKPTTFVYNLLIRAYAVNGFSREAVILYNSMICSGVGVDKFTFPFVMKACFCVEKAREVYGFAIKTGFGKDVYLENVLMDLCFKFGAVEDAVKVFDKMRVRTVVSWTTMIAGLVSNGEMDVAWELFEEMPVRNVVSWSAMVNAYAKSEKPGRAFELFVQMQRENVTPNEYTLVGLLVASAELGSVKLGSWVHDYAIKNGFEIGVFLGTALIDMYSKCGSLEDAQRVFESMESRSVATWNAMITSLGVYGRDEEAIALFKEMERTGVEPDGITFVGILSACVHANDMEEGRKYFYYMVERYGIKPTAEHYLCLFEMYTRAATMLEPESLSFPL